MALFGEGHIWVLPATDARGWALFRFAYVVLCYGFFFFFFSLRATTVVRVVASHDGRNKPMCQKRKEDKTQKTKCDPKMDECTLIIPNNWNGTQGFILELTCVWFCFVIFCVAFFLCICIPFTYFFLPAARIVAMCIPFFHYIFFYYNSTVLVAFYRTIVAFAYVFSLILFSVAFLFASLWYSLSCVLWCLFAFLFDW